MQRSYSGCSARRAQAERSRQRRACDGARSVSPVGHQHERQVAALRPASVVQPPRLVVPLDVEPAVGHVVAGQERLDLVAALGPAVPDDAHARAVSSRWASPPVAQQVVDDRVEPLLGRVPRLEQVVVEPDVVDRLDRHVGVGVGGEQHELRRRAPCARACSRNSMPVIAGIRWSDAISATGWPRRAQLGRGLDSASAPDVAPDDPDSRRRTGCAGRGRSPATPPDRRRP